MRRIINFYIIREISSLFLLGLSVFTLILLLGRLIKLTDMVVSRGVPLADVGMMIVYLMPSFLVFTIPMSLLLAVLLAMGRLSGDNEIIILKACGTSLLQLMPPVLLCAIVAAALSMMASVYGVSWGNTAFQALSIQVLKDNVAGGINEKTFWDEIPGIVLYTDRYDDNTHEMHGVVIHDGRDPQRPLTIFATQGKTSSTPGQDGFMLSLADGSIHSASADDHYRLVGFGSYIMTVNTAQKGKGNRSEIDMDLTELRRRAGDATQSAETRRKAATELHSRFSLPFASLVFCVLAVPLGIQNRRSGKSAGFTNSIAVLLTYYIVLTLFRTLAEKGQIPPLAAMWLPNVMFFSVGIWLLVRASRERPLQLPSLADIRSLLKRGGAE